MTAQPLTPAEARIVAAFDAAPDLIADARRYRALREEAELLADTWSRSSEYRRASELGDRLRAALAAVDSQ